MSNVFKKFQKLSLSIKLLIGLILLVVMVTIILMITANHKTTLKASPHYQKGDASSDNKVEALQTMTSQLINVQTNNNQLQQEVLKLQQQNQKTIADLKQSVAETLQNAISNIQAQTKAREDRLERQIRIKQSTHESSSDNSDTEKDDAFTWVSDLSQNGDTKDTANQNTAFDLKTQARALFKNHAFEDHTKKKPVKPVYTLPINATLTGASLMTPLVGRIPIDGKLTEPYHFKLVLSAHNLTANGYPMPGVHGAVASGIASGDMLGSCARGDIKSLTFIFNDGTISTTQAKGENQALGYLSSQTGNPCLAGTFHSNAGLFLGAQMGLAGAQGYANAVSSAQYMQRTTSEGQTIRTLIGNANKAALGQGGSAAAQAAQTWWNRRVENSFDYVYVPNLDPNTHKIKKVVINITQEIPIDHDPNKRKVSYENQTLFTHTRELD